MSAWVTILPSFKAADLGKQWFTVDHDINIILHKQT